MPFAVITGGSSGLGFSIAQAFVNQGYGVMLVARGSKGLDEAQKRLQHSGAIVETHAADLTSTEGIDSVAGILRERDVDVLVNNAGFGNYGRFWEMTDKEESDAVSLNVLALVRLTRAALPRMMERKRGMVLNVASTAGFQSLPYFSTYAATKAFVISFTEAVATELQAAGLKDVRASALCPGPMETGFQHRSGATKSTYGFLPWEDADAVARKAVATIETAPPVHVTSFINKLMIFINACTPRRLLNAVAEKIFRPKGAPDKAPDNV